MISKNRLAAAAISAGLVTSLLGMGVAQADPPGSETTPRPLVGVGSDTVQDVMNAISVDDTTKQIASYNATGSATFNTKKTGCDAVTRPNGSGAGVQALLDSLNGVHFPGCIQFARSSSALVPGTVNTPSLTYVPFAVDAVSFAVTSSSNLQRKYTLQNLKDMYHCLTSAIGPAGPGQFTPILPQAGSGTRKFWESTMGIADADVEAGMYPCIVDGVKNGQIIEEHTGTALDVNSIEPFSIGQYTDQASGLVIDRRGSAVLGVIDGTNPQLLNGGFSVKRDVFNVIPTSSVSDPLYANAFVGSGSIVCSDSATILKYGFALNPNCGSTSSHG